MNISPVLSILSSKHYKTREISICFLVPSQVSAFGGGGGWVRVSPQTINVSYTSQVLSTSSEKVNQHSRQSCDFEGNPKNRAIAHDFLCGRRSQTPCDFCHRMAASSVTAVVVAPILQCELYAAKTGRRHRKPCGHFFA